MAKLAPAGPGHRSWRAYHVSSSPDTFCTTHSTPPVAGGVGFDEVIPAGIRLVTVYEAHFDTKFHALEKVPESIANIKDRPPPLAWD